MKVLERLYFIVSRTGYILGGVVPASSAAKAWDNVESAGLHSSISVAQLRRDGYRARRCVVALEAKEDGR